MTPPVRDGEDGVTQDLAGHGAPQAPSSTEGAMTMAGNPQFAHEAAKIQQALTLLEDQMTRMRATAGQVDTVTQDVRSHYQAASSNTFTANMEDWIGQYNQVESSVNNLHEALTSAWNDMNAGEDQALTHASGWANDLSAISTIQSTLAGK
jgi:hypothetical protein